MTHPSQKTKLAKSPQIEVAVDRAVEEVGAEVEEVEGAEGAGFNLCCQEGHCLDPLGLLFRRSKFAGLPG